MICCSYCYNTLKNYCVRQVINLADGDRRTLEPGGV